MGRQITAVSFLLTCALFSLTRVHAQNQVDILYMKDGSKILGTIVEIVPEKTVKLRTRDGSEIVYELSKVERIAKENDASAPQDLLHQSYSDLGITLGTPAGINLLGAAWFSRLGLRAAGMTFGSNLNGFQGGLGLKLKDNAERRHSLEVVFGTSKAKLKEWTYAGVAYEWVTGGFVLDVGVSGGSGSYESPQVLLQLGYVYRFTSGVGE